MWDRISELNDGHHIAWAYCAGEHGGPPCGHAACNFRTKELPG
jgi:hypothetical protein